MVMCVMELGRRPELRVIYVAQDWQEMLELCPWKVLETECPARSPHAQAVAQLPPPRGKEQPETQSAKETDST